MFFKISSSLEDEVKLSLLEEESFEKLEMKTKRKKEKRPHHYIIHMGVIVCTS
jgi:hypothetical protein